MYNEIIIEEAITPGCQGTAAYFYTLPGEETKACCEFHAIEIREYIKKNKLRVELTPIKHDGVPCSLAPVLPSE